MANIQLDPWQEEAVNHRGNLLLCTGRRVGKTYVMAYKAAERMIESKITIIVASLTEEQAMIIVEMVKQILSENAPSMMKKKREDTNKKTITIKNGSKLISRPAGDNGDSLRGYNADILIIDEASRMGKFFWMAVTPIVLTTGGEMWLCSTPHGKQGYFWDRYNEAVNLKLPDARFKVIYTTTEQVIENREFGPAWTPALKAEAKKILEDEKRTMSSIAYGQEFQGLFLDELRRFFSDDIINKACILKRQQGMPTGDVLLGVDIARFGDDKINYAFIEKRNNNDHRQIESITKKKQDLYVTQQEIIHLNNVWKPRLIGLDAGSGSLGVSIFDNLMHEPKLKRKLRAMTNQKVSTNRDGTDKTRIFKEDMYENMLYMMEKGILKLLDDETLKQALRNVQKEIENNKVKIFAHPSADEVESLVRAAWLSEKEKLNNFNLYYI